MPAETRRNAGRVLVWLGVLAWVPFLALLAAGQQPSIWPFLALHLAGVIGGSLLRRSASPAPPAQASALGMRRALAGRALIALGILAWAPYIYQDSYLGQDISIGPYLAAHLSGVLGGGLLLLSAGLARWRARG
jgi:hypothetical protein